MANKYLLPCECGQSIPIEPSQAGQLVACSCGNRVEVPSMRDIRRLEQQPTAPVERRQKRSWTATAGILFVSGAVLVMTGLGAGGLAYVSRALLARNLPVRSQAAIDKWLGEIDAAPIHELVDIWNTTVEKRFSDADDSPWKLYRQEARKFEIVMWIGLAATLLGACIAASASFFKSSR
jgi:hypothetical protein